MPLHTWLNLLLFTGLILALSLYGLSVSGQFPSEHRAAELRSSGGRLILAATMIVCALSLATGTVFAWRTLPWYAAVIGAGLVLLATPLLLRPFPDWFVNGRAALLWFAGVAGAIAIAMLLVR